MGFVLQCTILYASTSGHTEYVAHVLCEHLGDKVQRIRVEVAVPEDLTEPDILILASGTWNTGGVEGQLNPHMDAFLRGRAQSVDFQGKRVAVIALGDDRYFYTARAGEHLRQFVQSHGGKVIEPVLTIVNEPYGQEGKIRQWGDKTVSQLLARL